jgi:hypothetical protein
VNRGVLRHFYGGVVSALQGVKNKDSANQRP